VWQELSLHPAAPRSVSAISAAGRSFRRIIVVDVYPLPTMDIWSLNSTRISSMASYSMGRMPAKSPSLFSSMAEKASKMF
jgi:hypothetical protein